jgi:ABC-type transport system substrate-binding protein
VSQSGTDRVAVRRVRTVGPAAVQRPLSTAGALAAVLVLVLLLAGCTPPGLPEPIAPTGAATAPMPPHAAGTVVVGLDGSAGRIAGFNPYSIADYSPAALAAASLVLPSAFVIAADGSTSADPDVIDAATVSSQEPFTVTYTLDRAASWSDGTPVTAEDFAYLRDELLVQPGTVDPAGYQLITDIRSLNAGKTVEVEFAEAFPDWRTLFSPLLPSHLMKDSPGGWGAALSADIPVSANRYRMTSYDPVTGQIRLARNDKYWGAPPGPAAVVLRLGDPTDLLAAFTREDVQALWFAPNAGMATALQAAIPADRRTVVPAAASVQLVFNTTTGSTADIDVRSGIAVGIDAAAVTQDLTASWPDGGAAVTSQVRLPSEQSSDQSGTEWPSGTADRSAARVLLARAGYGGDGLYVARDGDILRLTLGYSSGDPRLAAAARTIQQQLGLVGIEIDLLPDASQELVQTRIANGTVDLALVSLPRGVSDTVAALSAFGCPLDSAFGLGSTVTSTPPDAAGGTVDG